MEPFYTPSFTRHLSSLARSNYFARGLDADDLQFLEYVRRHGVANGNLPSVRVALLEELEFWNLPYTVQPGVERRVGPRARPVDEEAVSLRKARSNAWHARRIIRENQKAIAEAELVRERREWEKANARRKMRELISDFEWDAAAPKQFGRTVDRHYVPRWKLDEMHQAKSGKKSGKRALQERKSRKDAQQAAEALQRAAKEQAEVERIKQGLAELEQREEQEQRRKEAWTNVTEHERQRREAIIAEARATVERVNRLQRDWTDTAERTRYHSETIKRAIMTLLNSTPGQRWDVEMMMRALDVTDRALMDRCLNELVRGNRLRKVDMP